MTIDRAKIFLLIFFRREKVLAKRKFQTLCPELNNVVFWARARKASNFKKASALTFCPKQKLLSTKAKKKKQYWREESIGVFRFLISWKMSFFLFFAIYGVNTTHKVNFAKLAEVRTKSFAPWFFSIFFATIRMVAKLIFKKKVKNDPLYWQWMRYIFHNIDSTNNLARLTVWQLQKWLVF